MPNGCPQLVFKMAVKGECQERIQRQADKIIARIQEGHLDFSILVSSGNLEKRRTGIVEIDDNCIDAITRNHLRKCTSRIVRGKNRAWWDIFWKRKLGRRSPTSERKVKKFAMIWKRKQEKMESWERTRFQSHSMINNVTGSGEGRSPEIRSYH